MNDESLRKLWRQQEALPPQSTLPMEEQILKMQQRMNSYDRMIQRRDFREHAAGVFVIVCFGLYLLTDKSMLSRIGCVITILASAFTMVYPSWCKRSVRCIPAGQSVLDALGKELEKVEIEIRLLRSVMWWYLLPIMIGADCFYLGLNESFESKAWFLVITSVMCLIIWQFNQSAVNKHLLPLKEELEALKKSPQ